jgi:hypothetical protein
MKKNLLLFITFICVHIISVYAGKPSNNILTTTFTTAYNITKDSNQVQSNEQQSLHKLLTVKNIERVTQKNSKGDRRYGLPTSGIEHCITPKHSYKCIRILYMVN